MNGLTVFINPFWFVSVFRTRDDYLSVSPLSESLSQKKGYQSKVLHTQPPSMCVGEGTDPKVPIRGVPHEYTLHREKG